MVSNLAKFKWLLLFSLLPLSGYAADPSGFAIQLKGPGAMEISEQAKYGPITRADTLWSIAKEHRPSSGLSIYKTMAAIQTLNPSAFLNNDINRMIDGSILLLPSADQIKNADATALFQKLNKPVKKAAPSVTAASTPPVVASTKKAPAKKAVAADPDTIKATASADAYAAPATADVMPQGTKLSELQNELTAANEQLLLSSETNRRLKLQLAAIRAELEALKQDVEADNQLNAELKALVEQQQTQLSQQQAQMTEAENSALFGDLSFTNTTLIIAVVGLFVLLILVWLGLWLKNRNDQKQNDGSTDSTIFETDNAVDELSEYLTVENYSATEHSVDTVADNMSAFDDDISMSADADVDFVISNDDPDLNLSALGEPELNVPVSELNAAVAETADAEVADKAAEHDDSTQDNVVQLPTEGMIAPETSFSDLDVTLDDVSTSFDDDEVHPDLSWRDELNEETPVVDAEVNDEPSLIPETASVETSAEDDDDAADLSDIEAMLAEYNPELANTGSETEDTPAQKGQTVDEMLAQLEQSESSDAELSAIDAVLSEFSPNAFNEAPADQMPVDVDAAKEEEFIDIDKLLSDVATEPSAVEEEPYDKVSLDVGLDEYTNTEAVQRDAAEDEEASTIGAKLDLARAYLEIDDKEGAKSILEQLTSVGSTSQQVEVSKLLSRL